MGETEAVEILKSIPGNQDSISLCYGATLRVATFCVQSRDVCIANAPWFWKQAMNPPASPFTITRCADSVQRERASNSNQEVLVCLL